jgi:hypothetical protein
MNIKRSSSGKLKGVRVLLQDSFLSVKRASGIGSLLMKLNALRTKTLSMRGAAVPLMPNIDFACPELQCKTVAMSKYYHELSSDEKSAN